MIFANSASVFLLPFYFLFQYPVTQVSSLLDYFFQTVHYILTANPRNYVGLDFCRMLHLHQQPVHGEVPPGEGYVLGPQNQRRAHVVGPVSDVKHPLERSATSLHLPVGQILLKDHLLAHIFRTTGARVRVEREKNELALGIESARVCENLREEVEYLGVLQPRLDKVGVGVGHHHQLEVLNVALQKLQEFQEARGRGDLLHRRVDGFLGHALLRHEGQNLLHVLVVVAYPEAVCEPGGELLIRQNPNHSVVAVFADDGLIKVKQHQEALVLLFYLDWV